MLEPRLASRCLASLSAAVLLSIAAAWIGPDVARAETAIAVDLDAIVPVDPDEIDSGPGFAIRLGQQIHLPMVALTPELGFNWGTFGDGPSVYRGIAGLRLGVGELFRLGVFAHIGFGHMSYDGPGPFDYSHTGLTFDGGAFLDLTLLPLLDIGVHLAYNRLNGDEEELAPDVGWMTFGAHVALII
jgi:hypothetical protein